MPSYTPRLSSISDALSLIRSGDTIWVAGVNHEPKAFLSAFPQIIPRLENVTLLKSKDNDYDFLRDPATVGHVETLSHFFHANLREGHALGLVSYVPSDLHNYMALRTSYRPNNVFIAAVTEMDENGCFQIPYCQMFEQEAFRCADTVILEINPRFRRVRGGLEIPSERVSCCYVADTPMMYLASCGQSTAIDQTIGSYVADMIHDGDCLQLGIGGLPDAIAKKLFDKNDLGVHSEMICSTMGELIENGNFTGKRKQIDVGEHIFTFVLGNEHLHDVVSDVPACRIASASYVNDPFVIAQNNNMISVNTALEIDLTGQICSESIGPMQWSGSGGASDFAFGALHSRGGRGVVAFSSTTKKGTISRVKSILTPGAAVTISRNLADTVVTEYGVAELRGRSVRERAEQLISIAHPDYRGTLRAEARKLGYIR